MGKMLRDFGRCFKEYIDYIIKVPFGELVFHFFELLIIILMALFTYVPMYLIQDVVLNLIRIFSENLSEVFLDVYAFVFSVIEILIALFAFLYLFYKRYESLKKDKAEGKIENKKEDKKKVPEKNKVDLPKLKDE